VSVLSVDSDHYEFLRPPLVQDVGAAISRRSLTARQS
jgi:hypothetical protein